MDTEIAYIDHSTWSARGVDVALLDLAQAKAALIHHLDRLLVPAEKTQLTAMGNFNRRVEWIGARASIKHLALKSGLVGDALQCFVAKDSLGRPSLVSLDDAPIPGLADCSLSHKNRFACAALAKPPATRTGIDIEQIGPRVRRLRTSFLNPNDIMVSEVPDDMSLTALWTLKEAYSKLIGVGLRIDLQAITCSRRSEDASLSVQSPSRRPAEAAYLRCRDYVIGLCFI